MARKFPKACPRLIEPHYIELRGYREKRWKRPRSIKPGTRSFSNMFACKRHAQSICRSMKKKINVKDCRVKTFRAPTKFL